MIAEFISPQDARWRQHLSVARHDFYHLPQYVEMAGKHEEGEPVAFYAEAHGAAFLVPLLIREIPDHLNAPRGWFDATSPYGYPAPLLWPEESSGMVSGFLEAFRVKAVEWNMITAFIRLHPLFALWEEQLVRHGTLLKHGQTVYIDLSLPLEEIQSQTRTNHKRDIRKLRKSGFTVRTDDWNLLGEFIRLYRDTMVRLSASESYMYSDSYFDDLREALGEQLHLISVLSPSGTLAASGLFTCTNGITQYHLGGTAGDYLAVAPSKLMFDFVIPWAQEIGSTILHLGGGYASRTDSLFHFKAGFSKLTLDFHTFRMVLDEERNRYLNQLWQEQAAITEVESTDFFPLYRRNFSTRTGPVSQP